MKDQFVLITGGSGGIGTGITRRLLAEGYRIIILDLVEPDRSIEVEFHKIDLLDTKAVNRVLEELTKRYTVTRLVNNVGIVRPALLEDTTPEQFEEVMMLNARTAMICTQALAPAMVEAKFGRIVSVTSRALLGKEMRTAYSASKAAVEAMSRTWALELAGKGITVNTVAPGPIETDAFTMNNQPDDPRTKKIKDSVPIKLLGNPADVAHAISFFLDEKSGFVTGQTLYVCGGITVGLKTN